MPVSEMELTPFMRLSLQTTREDVVVAMEPSHLEIMDKFTNCGPGPATQGGNSIAKKGH